MDALYKKVAQADSYRYRFAEGVSLFGCNNGYIPWLLLKTMERTASEPLPWHLDIDAALRTVDQGDHAYHQPQAELQSRESVLYEVMEVFGHSADGWTPVMLYLRRLFVDEDPSRFDAQDPERGA